MLVHCSVILSCEFSIDDPQNIYVPRRKNHRDVDLIGGDKGFPP
jgi:hypothetical protein